MPPQQLGIDAIPRVYSVNGKGEIDTKFPPANSETVFRILFIRIHFAGTPNTTSDVILSLDAITGEEYDTTLYTFKDRGVGNDCFLALLPYERSDPTPWTFRKGDRLAISWGDGIADTLRWGVEIGYET